MSSCFNKIIMSIDLPAFRLASPQRVTTVDCISNGLTRVIKVANVVNNVQTYHQWIKTLKLVNVGP